MKIGIDILDVGRNIPDGVFSEYELEYIKGKGQGSIRTATGIFAAKEAYFKAKGTGIIKSELKKVEVRHKPGGAPYYGNDHNAALSISHTDTTAVAVCILF